MSERLLKLDDIPDTLWHRIDEILILPSNMCKVYRSMLNGKGLMEVVLSKDVDDGPVGGIQDDDTKKHFATRFSGSVARVQLAGIDPKEDLSNASDLFIKAFSGGRVGLLDIPCGAGAASIALLGCIAELRRKKVLPRELLEVFLVGGDISPYARSYAGEFVDTMRPTFEREGIFVREKWMTWDAIDAESTTNVLHTWMEWAHDCREYFVVMANFSGFLQTDGKLKDAQKQLDEVFRWAAQRRSTVIWVEPQTKDVEDALLPRVREWFKHKLPSLFSAKWGHETSIGASAARYRHPVKPASIHSVRLRLIRLESTDP